MSATILQFLKQLPWESTYAFLRVVFIALDIVLAIALAVLFVRCLKLRPRLFGEESSQTRETAKGVFQKVGANFNTENFSIHWREIEKRAEEDKPESLILAVISADNLVDSALKEMNIPGEHMADRLKYFTRNDFKQIEDLWRAHKLRNELVHTPGFTLTKEDAKEILDVYESFLRAIGALS